MNDEQKTVADPLDHLAMQAEQLTAAPAAGEELDKDQQAAADQESQQAAQAMLMIEGGTVKVLHYLLKWGRSKIGKDLPEIHD